MAEVFRDNPNVGNSADNEFTGKIMDVLDGLLELDGDLLLQTSGDEIRPFTASNVA